MNKLEWYGLRWKIETLFRTLKTGCRIEETRLANRIALCCVVAGVLVDDAQPRGTGHGPCCDLHG